MVWISFRFYLYIQGVYTRRALKSKSSDEKCYRKSYKSFT